MKFSKKGVALLITLSVITVLLTVILELNRKVRSALISTLTIRDQLSLEQMAASGIHIAMAMLLKDKATSSIDTLQEDWANESKINELLSDIPFEKGKLSLVISDELGKIQINALVDFPRGRQVKDSQKIMWDRLTRLLISASDKFKEIEVTAIVDSLIDWLDSGDDDAITGLNGAESDYYEDLNPPYVCKNGPLDHIGELALVKGITPELFQGLPDIPGLSNFVTVFGMTIARQPFENKKFTFDGKININTAELPVLVAMIPSENIEFAQNIFDYRQEMENGIYIHDLSSPTWYKNAPGCADLTIDPNLISLSSDIFRVEATANLDEMKITVTSVIQRQKDAKSGNFSCKILSWETG